MKTLPGIVICNMLAITTGCGQNPEATRPQVNYLVAGQSNAVSPAQNHPLHFSSTGLVTINDPYNDPQVLRVPTAASPMLGSVSWIYLGDMLNREVTFKNIARGNTSTAVWRNELFAARMAPALHESKFDAVLWVQGESDMGEHFTEQQTYENMRWVIEESRKIQPPLTWYVALDSDISGAFGGDNSVRRAQKRIIADGLALRGPDCDKIRENPLYMETTFGEFVGDGLREHGRLWYEVLTNNH